MARSEQGLAPADDNDPGGSGPVRRLLGRGSIYTAGTLLQIASAALVVPIATRLLGPAGYGEAALAFGVQVLVAAVIALGLPAAVSRDFFEPGAQGSAARSLILTSIIVSGLGALLVGVTVPLWSDVLGLSSDWILALGVALAFSTAVITATLGLLQAQERAFAFVAFALTGSIGAQASGLLAMVMIDADPVVYLGGYAVVSYGSAAGSIVAAGAHRARPIGGRALRRAFAYGAPTVPHSVAVFALALGDRFVIQALRSAEAVGRYQVAYALGSLGMTLLSSIQAAWLPQTFNADEATRWPTLAALATLVVEIGIGVASLLALLSPFLLSILAPEEFGPTALVPVAAWIAAAAVPWAIYLPAVQVLFWERETKPLVWIAPIAAVTNIVLAAALIGPLGLEGVAIATFLAIVIQMALTLRSSSAIAHVPWQWPAIARAVGLGAMALAVGAYLPAGALEDAVRIGLAALITLGLMKRLVSASNLRNLKS